MRKSLFLFFILTCGLTAQTAPEPLYQDTIKFQTDQVTITATRYAENVLEIPYAVTILTPEKLAGIKGYGLDEVLSSVPGVLAQSRAGNQDIRIVIRGFGARGAGDRSNSGTSRGIRIMLDGIPETEPDGRTSFDNIDPSLASEIEVIRSNSSALWGNAAGGVINISSFPKFSSPFLRLNSIYGSFGLRKYTLQAGTVLGNGKLAASVSSTEFDGWREHSSGYRYILNIGMKSVLSQNTELGLFVVGASNKFNIPGPLNQAEFDADPTLANPVYNARDERRFNRLARIAATLDHSINENNQISAMVYVNPKFLQRSERGTFRDFTRYHLGGNIIYHLTNHFSDKVKNRITMGLDEAYQDGAILFYSLSPTNGRGPVLRDNRREGADNFGAFLQTELMINDEVSIIAGGRYDNITYYSESFIDPKLGLQKRSFEKFTPKGGLTYRFSPVQSIYFNLGGGVEVPAGNETDPAGTYGQDTVYLINPLLEPISSTTYELGTKHLLYFGEKSLVNSLTYNVALYYIKVKNDIIPYRGGRFYFTAGETDRMGIEVGIELQLIQDLMINGSLTYSSNKYLEYAVDSVHYGRPGALANYKDNKVAGIPDLFYSLGTTYEISKLSGLYFSVNVSGMGKYFVDDANTLEVPSYNILNLTVGLSDPVRISDHFGIRAFLTVNNLTDEKYAASAFINPDSVNGRPVFLEPGLPRNITASVSLAIN